MPFGFATIDLKSLNQSNHKPHTQNERYVGYDHRTAKLASTNVQTEQKI